MDEGTNPLPPPGNPPTVPIPDSPPLPLPPGGLPPGWTNEQWHTYGAEWKKQQSENTHQAPIPETVPTPVIHIDRVSGTTQAGTEYESLHTRPEAYGSVGRMTTSTTQQIPGQMSNPYILDPISNSHLNRIAAPNAEAYKRTIINSQFQLQTTTSAQQLHQTDGEDPDLLIERMKISDEKTISSDTLKVRKISFSTTTQNGSMQFSNSHLGVRCEITNKRLLLIDSTLNTEDTLSKTSIFGNFFSLPRSQESFQLRNRRTNDIWFKPIPLNNITGIEISSSHSAMAEMKTENRRSPLVWVGLSIAFATFMFGILFLLEGEPTLSILLFVSFTASFLLSVWAYVMVAYSVKTKPFGITNKSRTIEMGYYDPVFNIPLVMKLELEDSQSLTLAYEWSKTLQQAAPQLGESSSPLILK
jgi:hypothetical protein